MDTRRVSRRRFVGVAGGGLMAATAGPFVLRHARAAGKEVVVCSSGGSHQKALRKTYFDPFEKEPGIKVIDASVPEVAKVKAQVDSRNPEWDVIEAGTRWYYVLVSQGLVQPLDMKKINAAPLMPEAVLSHGIGHNVVGSRAMAARARRRGCSPPPPVSCGWTAPGATTPVRQHIHRSRPTRCRTSVVASAAIARPTGCSTTRSGGSGAIPVLPRERRAKKYML